eukprot:1318279-Amphidinium_carterae.1
MRSRAYNGPTYAKAALHMMTTLLLRGKHSSSPSKDSTSEIKSSTMHRQQQRQQRQQQQCQAIAYLYHCCSLKSS